MIEAVLLLGFAIPLWAKRVNQFPPGKEALVVHVVAQQFSFNYHLPGPDGQFGRRDASFVSNSNPVGLDPNDPAGKDDIVTSGELHVPVNRPVIAELSSKDVIHDFFLPSMRIAGDAIPGSLIPIWFTPVNRDLRDYLRSALRSRPFRNERDARRRYTAGLSGLAERTRRTRRWRAERRTVARRTTTAAATKQTTCASGLPESRPIIRFLVAALYERRIVNATRPTSTKTRRS